MWVKCLACVAGESSPSTAEVQSACSSSFVVDPCGRAVWYRSFAGISASNPVRGMDVSVVSVVYRSLRRADLSCRGVLPTVVCY